MKKLTTKADFQRARAEIKDLLDMVKTIEINDKTSPGKIEELKIHSVRLATLTRKYLIAFASLPLGGVTR